MIFFLRWQTLRFASHIWTFLCYATGRAESRAESRCTGGEINRFSIFSFNVKSQTPSHLKNEIDKFSHNCKIRNILLDYISSNEEITINFRAFRIRITYYVFSSTVSQKCPIRDKNVLRGTQMSCLGHLLSDIERRFDWVRNQEKITCNIYKYMNDRFVWCYLDLRVFSMYHSMCYQTPPRMAVSFLSRSQLPLS